MKRTLVILCLLTAAALWAQDAAQDAAQSAAPHTAQSAGKKTLYVYDEVNESSTPYIELFRAALAERALAERGAYDEATAAEVEKRDLASYDRLVIHAMYMAFNMQSPVRDWLKGDPKLAGKEVSLFVTSNRSKAEKLSGQLTKLLKKDGAVVVDAVSMATKELDTAGKAAAVKDQVGRLK